jgi:hypothetical protein
LKILRLLKPVYTIRNPDKTDLAGPIHCSDSPVIRES